MNKKLLITSLLVILVLLIGGAYYVTAHKSQPKPKVTSQTASGSPVVTPTPTGKTSSDVYVNPNTTHQAITKAIQSGIYTGLPNYMADSVAVTVAGSPSATMTKEKVIQKLAMLKTAASPWTFTDANPTIQKIKKDNAVLQNAFIGLSSNRYLAAFILNKSQLIETIILSNDYRTLTVAP